MASALGNRKWHAVPYQHGYPDGTEQTWCVQEYVTSDQAESDAPADAHHTGGQP